VDVLLKLGMVGMTALVLGLLGIACGQAADADSENETGSDALTGAPTQVDRHQEMAFIETLYAKPETGAEEFALTNDPPPTVTTRAKAVAGGNFTTTILLWSTDVGKKYYVIERKLDASFAVLHLFTQHGVELGQCNLNGSLPVGCSSL
jgi:hypothetical protein